MNNNYIAQRLATIGGITETNTDITQRLEALEAENARLKEQLKQVPQMEFKSEVQISFENSPEFESMLNIYYMRFLRARFSLEFRDSPHMKAFQDMANQAFAEFEKNIKKGEAKNAQNSSGKKAVGVGGADNKQDS